MTDSTFHDADRHERRGQVKTVLLGWLIRLLIAVLVVRAISSFVSGLFTGAAASPKPPSRKSVPLVRDPVCGTYIDPSRAISAKTGATVHYFCSENCRQVFRPSA